MKYDLHPHLNDMSKLHSSKHPFVDVRSTQRSTTRGHYYEARHPLPSPKHVLSGNSGVLSLRFKCTMSTNCRDRLHLSSPEADVAPHEPMLTHTTGMK